MTFSGQESSIVVMCVAAKYSETLKKKNLDSYSEIVGINELSSLAFSLKFSNLMKHRSHSVILRYYLH